MSFVVDARISRVLSTSKIMSTKRKLRTTCENIVFRRRAILISYHHATLAWVQRSTSQPQNDGQYFRLYEKEGAVDMGSSKFNLGMENHTQAICSYLWQSSTQA